MSATPLPAGHWTVTVTAAQPYQVYPSVRSTRALATPPAPLPGVAHLALFLTS